MHGARYRQSVYYIRLWITGFLYNTSNNQHCSVAKSKDYKKNMRAWLATFSNTNHSLVQVHSEIERTTWAPRHVCSRRQSRDSNTLLVSVKRRQQRLVRRHWRRRQMTDATDDFTHLTIKDAISLTGTTNSWWRQQPTDNCWSIACMRHIITLRGAQPATLIIRNALILANYVTVPICVTLTGNTTLLYTSGGNIESGVSHRTWLLQQHVWRRRATAFRYNALYRPRMKVRIEYVVPTILAFSSIFVVNHLQKKHMANSKKRQTWRCVMHPLIIGECLQRIANLFVNLQIYLSARMRTFYVTETAISPVATSGVTTCSPVTHYDIRMPAYRISIACYWSAVKCPTDRWV